jgi:cytochrome P450
MESICKVPRFVLITQCRFGEPFDMLKTGKKHHFIIVLHRFMKGLSILGAIPWLTSLVDKMPASGDIKEVERFSRQCFDRRQAKSSSRKDIFYYLLGEDKESGSKLNEPELVIESRTAIVGGSDTTAITLGYVWRTNVVPRVLIC